MDKRKLLLLSNSTNYEESYLGFATPIINHFLGGTVKNVVFIPYAGITINYDDYTARVQNALGGIGLSILGIHGCNNKLEAIENADAIMVGGGNSFALLNQLYVNGLLDIIREKVRQGTPYVGWSAGSNMACPTLKTTNDMPIVEPPSFDALGLIPFQINPHYTESSLPDHGGETRMDRLNEFLIVNQEIKILGLQEGCALKVEGNQIEMIGDKPAKVYEYGKKISKVTSQSDLNFLMH